MSAWILRRTGAGPGRQFPGAWFMTALVLLAVAFVSAANRGMQRRVCGTGFVAESRISILPEDDLWQSGGILQIGSRLGAAARRHCAARVAPGLPWDALPR